MTFEFDIEVRPDFEVPEWKGLKLERQVHEYSDEEVDASQNAAGESMPDERRRSRSGRGRSSYLKSLHVQGRRYRPFSASPKVETLEIKPTLSFSDANLEGFDKLVVGAKAGDKKETKVTISSEAENEGLARQRGFGRTEVTAVKRLDLPELTPAFLDKIGGFEDEDELREAVRQELERQLDYHQQRAIRQQITAVLTKDADWELPPDLLKATGWSRNGASRSRVAFQWILGRRDSPAPESVAQNSLASTSRALKEHFILERIAEENEMDAEPEDFDNEVKDDCLAGPRIPAPRSSSTWRNAGKWMRCAIRSSSGKVIDLINRRRHVQ